MVKNSDFISISNLLLRNLGDEINGEESHCFCGKVNKGLAMIACDYCLEWYHMQCVQVIVFRNPNLPVGKTS